MFFPYHSGKYLFCNDFGIPYSNSNKRNTDGYLYTIIKGGLFGSKRINYRICIFLYLFRNRSEAN